MFVRVCVCVCARICVRVKLHTIWLFLIRVIVEHDVEALVPIGPCAF